MDVRNAQRRLGLTPDGVLGPKTWAGLFTHGGAKPARAEPLGEAMAEYGRDIDTPLEIAHFLGQAGHETTGFKNLVELGGPTYCAKYDGRRDLGNCKAGDGYKFRGRGIFQNTGRDAYLKLATKFSVDLLATPDRLAEPEYAVRAALDFWRTRGLAALAARNDGHAITKKINGGINGLVDRATRTAAIMALFK